MRKTPDENTRETDGQTHPDAGNNKGLREERGSKNRKRETVGEEGMVGEGETN